MAPSSEYTVATALSAQVLSHDEGSILVEAGGIAAAGWFLEHGLRPNVDGDEDGEPPTKRRKTDPMRSVQIESPDESHHVPVARVTIDLHFPETLNAKAAKKKAILEDVNFEDVESISVTPSIIDLFEEGTRLKLALRRKKGAVLMVDTAGISNKVQEALRKNAVSRIRQPSGLKLKESEHPASW